jgi:hypothetical protein
MEEEEEGRGKNMFLTHLRASEKTGFSSRNDLLSQINSKRVTLLETVSFSW